MSINALVCGYVCVYQSVSFVWMSVCSYAHCAKCVCSSNTGFSLHYPPHLFPFFSPHLWWLNTRPLSISNQTLFIYPLILYSCTETIIHLSCCSPTQPLHPSVHTLTYPFTKIIWLPSINSPHHPSSSVFFTTHLWFPALTFLFLPHPVHFVLLFPSSLPLSLSHSALCLALSGWAAPRWLRVCVHSGACRASPPPGLTTRFCLSPLNSATPPFLPSSLAISSFFQFLLWPLHMTAHATLVQTDSTHSQSTLPSNLLFSFSPAQLLGSSLVPFSRSC